MPHPELSVRDYSLLIDSTDWELDLPNMLAGKTAVVFLPLHPTPYSILLDQHDNH